MRVIKTSTKNRKTTTGGTRCGTISFGFAWWMVFLRCVVIVLWLSTFGIRYEGRTIHVSDIQTYHIPSSLLGLRSASG